MKTLKMILSIAITIIATIWQVINAAIGYFFFFYIVIKIVKHFESFWSTNSLFSAIVTIIFSIVMMILSTYAIVRACRAGKFLFSIKENTSGMKTAFGHLKTTLWYTVLIPLIFVISFAIIKGWLPYWVQEYFVVYQIIILGYTVYKVFDTYDNLKKSIKTISNISDSVE